MYRNIDNYSESYERYIEEENEEYKEVFNINYCAPRSCPIADDSIDDDSIDINTDTSNNIDINEQ